MTEITVVYAREKAPNAYKASIFLEGPTPTVNGAHSWRTDVLRLLAQAGYEGVVFVPESRPDEFGNTRFRAHYTDQVEWEYQHRQMADVILAWVPRTTQDPGITTNYELGEDMDSGKLVFGAPDDSWKTRYPRYWATKLKVPVSSTLEDTVANALVHLGTGEKREGGERYVPLFVWRTEHFQQWYASQKAAKHRLDHAKVVWSWRVGPQRKFIFFWILHVKLWSETEQRHKSNEVVLSRPDISTIVLYQRAPVLDDSIVVLIKEFRSPASNPTGYVYENSGGSSWKKGADPLERASEENFEETGLTVAPSRFAFHGVRQVLPTLSAHRAHVYSVELTDDEVAWLRTQADVVHGVEEDTERTYTVVTTLGAIRQGNLVGWADLGMILQVLAK